MDYQRLAVLARCYWPVLWRKTALMYSTWRKPARRAISAWASSVSASSLLDPLQLQAH